MVDNEKKVIEQHTNEVFEVMQNVWHQSKGVIYNLRLYSNLVTEQTQFFIQQLTQRKSVKAPAKSRSGFVNLLEFVDQYAAQIDQYHDLLNSDACSYQIPLEMYKRLRHELVVQVVSDVRRINSLINQLSGYSGDFLLTRWMHELHKLTQLDFARLYR
jgi:hypothetical protein